MFAHLSVGDRFSLCLETWGHAFEALALPHRSIVLRGPIGFSAPFVLRRELAMAALGAVGLVLVGVAAWRVRAARAPAALLVGTLLPVVNIVPTGLESRMNDRFLYLPSLGLALGLVVMLGALHRRGRRPWHYATAALAGLSLALLALAHGRTLLFRSGEALWTWERSHGDRASTVLAYAGDVSVRAGRIVEARDRRLETALRFVELGFAEGFPHALDAARLQVAATGRRHRPSQDAYARALMALIEGYAERVAVPFHDGGGVTLPTGDPEARAFAQRRQRELQLQLLLLSARRGARQAGAVAEQLVADCVRCRRATLAAARVQLALVNPDRALLLLRRLPRSDAEVAALVHAASLQQRVLANAATGQTSDLARAKAYFVGEAYGPACRSGGPGLGSAAGQPQERELVALACMLDGDDEAWLALRPRAGDLMQQAIEWRTTPSKREALLLSTL
jgi:hypothetical protein